MSDKMKYKSQDLDMEKPVGLDFEPSDRKRLKEAVELLENPGWVPRITNLIGMPLEWVLKRLPKGTKTIISKATEQAIKKALRIAVFTMDHQHHGKPLKWTHRGAVSLSGGLGGFFGLSGLTIELPISTAIMLRSIADIARSEGENIKRVESQLACIEVFALGSERRPSDDATETGYYAVRIALARTFSEAAQFIAEKGLVEEGAPVLIRLVTRIASRFGVIVSEKVAAEIVPVIGAVGGATVNLLFIHHFQRMAKGHFIVRSLERKYNPEIVKKEYDKIAKTG